MKFMLSRIKDQEKSLRREIKRDLEYIIEQAQRELAMLNEGAELTEKMAIRTIQSSSVKVAENSVQLEETLRTLHIIDSIKSSGITADQIPQVF
jgi:hypothetical protein